MAGPVADVVAAAGEHVTPLLDRIERRLTEVVRGHGPVLSAHASATIAAGGKRLRPLLVILGATSDGRDDDAVVRAAVAVELVHSATLVHDDVLDVAALRRGEPTVFAAAGREAATQTGDLLFALAFTELAAGGDAEQVRALSDAGSALAQGELLQRADAYDAAVSIERYLERCELKTARLFSAAVELGARCAGEEPGVLPEFGRRVGLAFQILDDVLDVQGPPERTGKNRGTDLLDGTVTLPFILGREREPGLRALDVRAIAPAGAEAVCDAIAASGALDAARRVALDHVAAAKELLGRVPGAPRRAALSVVAGSVVERYS